MVIKHRFKKIEDLTKRCIKVSNGCLEWSGAKKKGYGMTTSGGKFYRTHRLMWILHYGDIPNDKQINHTCDNSICSNIEHLYLGTHDQNVRDMILRKRHRNSRKTHCQRGHAFDEKNTRTTSLGARVCRKCHAAKNVENKKKLRRERKKLRRADGYDFVFNKNTVGKL